MDNTVFLYPESDKDNGYGCQISGRVNISSIYVLSFGLQNPASEESQSLFVCLWWRIKPKVFFLKEPEIPIRGRISGLSDFQMKPAGLWIRIRMDPHSEKRLDPDPQKINADPVFGASIICTKETSSVSVLYEKVPLGEAWPSPSRKL